MEKISIPGVVNTYKLIWSPGLIKKREINLMTSLTSLVAANLVTSKIDVGKSSKLQQDGVFIYNNKY